MKNLKNNKKGFTLIELLAVIVILAILVAVAVPAVSRYLSQARRGTFASNANTAISNVRTDTTSAGLIGTAVYDLKDINNLLQKTLDKSPYGYAYSSSSYVKAVVNMDGTSTYYICLADTAGNGIAETIEKDVNESKVTAVTTDGASVSCTLPTGDDIQHAKTHSDGTFTTYGKEDAE